MAQSQNSDLPKAFSDTDHDATSVGSVNSDKTIIAQLDRESGPRKCNRFEVQHITKQLFDIIENCSTIHESFRNELVAEEVTYNRLTAMHAELKQGEQNIITTHSSLKSTLERVEPDQKLINQIDGTLADCRNLVTLVLEKMNKLSARSKTPEQLISDTPQANIGTGQTTPLLLALPSVADVESSNKAPSSITSSKRSKAISSSKYSSSTRASSSLRLMQVEAAADLAVQKKKLQSHKETQQLEEKARQLTRAIEQHKIQADIEAAEIKQKIISQALEEEGLGTFHHPPSRNGNESQINFPDIDVIEQTEHQIIPENAVGNILANKNFSKKPSVTPVNSENYDRYHYKQHHIAQENPCVKDTNLVEQSSIKSLAATPVTVDSNQEAFAETLAQAISTMKLKPAEPTIFNGEPLNYLNWKVSFEGLIESGRHSPLQKLAYLQQYLGGKAKEAVSEYFQIGTEEAFKDAKRKLDKRFGQPYVISEAYRSKLETWPSIKEYEGEALQDLADFLDSCKSAMQTVPELHFLNDRRENIKILEKLPLSVGRRWVKKATQIESNTQSFPKLHDFCKFLNQEASIATNSLSQALAKRANSSKSQTDANKRQSKRSPATEQRAHAFLSTDNNNVTENISNENQPKPVKYPCLHCQMDNHGTGECFKLGQQTHAEIEELFRKNNLCFSCAKPFHTMKACRHPAKCKRKNCEKQHLTIFHEHKSNLNTDKNNASDHSQSNQRNTNQSNSQIMSDEKPAIAHNCVDSRNKPSQMLSWTIPVYISTKADPHHEVLVYALLDSGSSHTFITSDTLNRLNAVTYPQNMNISTLTNTAGTHSNRMAATDLLVRGYRQQKYLALPHCISQSRIPSNKCDIPNAMTIQEWPHLKHLTRELISEEEGNKLELGLLIGGNMAQVFIPREVIVRGDHEPFARLTDLGWTFMGNAQSTYHPKAVTNHAHAIVNRSVTEPVHRSNITFRVQSEMQDDSLEQSILKLFSSDFQTTVSDELKTLSIDDIQFLKTMNAEIHKDHDGYVTMPLPLKNLPSQSNRSKEMAMKRLKLLEKKLIDPKFAQHYHSFMNEIINQGDAERIPDNELDKPDSWYIPHFGVYHPKKPEKIRVVFDGSAKVGGACLNDFLMQGPDQMNSLVGILLRFRREQVGIACDIGRMFHQFRVPVKHRDYLRFLWFDSQKNIVCYRMKVHLFGAASSPACATFGLRALCKMSSNNNNLAKDFINKDFYVDDGLTSTPDVEVGKTIVRDAISICQEGNLRLHKFTSNSANLLESIPESERNVQDIQSLDPDNISQPQERTLGLIGSLKSDSFKFDLKLKHNPNTRRGVFILIGKKHSSKHV